MNARFYLPDAEATGQLAALPSAEAEHLTRVLRLAVGDAIRVFNGRGAEFDAVVAAISKSGVEVHVGAARDPAPEPRVLVTIAHAVLKGDKMDDVVRDAVMMGASAIQPLVTARTEVTLSALTRGHRQERWQRIAIASAKQCGRAVVPLVAEPQPFDWVVSALADVQLPQPAVMLIEPSASSDVLSLDDLDAVAPREATVLVGPEGGWAPQEVERAAAACRLVTLGGRTFRADAMAIVAMAALFSRWREF